MTYDDGTESEIQEISIIACSGKESQASAYGFGGIFMDADSWYYDVDDFDTDYNICLYEFVIATDETKKVKSLTFESQTSRAYPVILSLAKVGKQSGIIDINAGAAERKIIAIYNLQGLPVKNPTTGIYIVRFSDGTVKKIAIQ